MTHASQGEPHRKRFASMPGRSFGKVLTGRFGQLLIALILLLLLAPLLAEHPWGIVIVGICSALVLIAGLHAARANRQNFIVGLVLAGVDFGLGRLAMGLGSRGLLVVQAILWLVTLIFVTSAILETIFRSKRVTLETLLSALCVYLLIGLIATFAFVLVELTAPGSFRPDGGEVLAWGVERATSVSFMRLLCLSYAILSGAGTTEIGPVGGFATNVVSLEALVGQIYLAVVLARVITIETEEMMHEPKRSIEELKPHDGAGVP